MKGICESFSFVGESISAAARNIAANRLRSGITAAIIALGVAALVGTQTSIDALASLLSGAFGEKTDNSLTVSALPGKRKSVINRQCLKLLGDNFGAGGGMTIYAVVPAFGDIRGPLGQLHPGTVVMAFEGDYLRANALDISVGRRFCQLEEAAGSRVCLVGQSVAEALGEGSPVGKYVTVAGHGFRVAGIISEQLSFLGVIAGNTVFVPLSAAWGSLLGNGSCCSADLMLPPGTDADEASGRADFLMRKIRGIQPSADADFEITRSDALEKEIGSLSGKLSLVALAVGLLTILGAAVGLTNIMLIATKERTRETGVRRAIGASRKDITLDLLTESALICLYGCGTGIILGLLAGNILSAILHTPLQIPWDWICASCLICTTVCTAAGWIPAHRAAKMDPVEALRCE